MPSKLMAFFLLFALTGVYAFADTLPPPAAARTEGSTTLYYATLHEAVAAASGLSPNAPDVITLLADITVFFPIIIEDGVHIMLVAGGGARTIMRGSDFLDYPIIWVRGDYSSLNLGMPFNSSHTRMAYDLVIDGGYLNSLPIEANAALIAVNGLGAKLIMHDRVTLQNNLNKSTTNINTFYQNGAGVLIRTRGDLSHNPAEFIMKDGAISGNINAVQSSPAYGGGVYVSGFGIFTMEGGAIYSNTAQRAGGGVFIYSTGSFIKTGGTIHGIDSPISSPNMAIDGVGPDRSFGHAIFVGTVESNFFRYRNDTVEENDMLSYTGSPRGSGVYGEGEKWSRPRQELNINILLIVPAVFVLALFGFILFRKILNQKRLNHDSMSLDQITGVKLSPREKEVFELFIKGHTAKQTAQELGLTISSVNHYSESLYRKLGIQSRTELLVKYRE